jgi:hypothetical protein
MNKNLIALLVTTIFIAPVMATSPVAPAAAESVQAVKFKTKAVVKLAKANKAPLKKSIEDPVDPMKKSIENPIEPISPTF